MMFITGIGYMDRKALAHLIVLAESAGARAVLGNQARTTLRGLAGALKRLGPALSRTGITPETLDAITPVPVEELAEQRVHELATHSRVELQHMLHVRLCHLVDRKPPETLARLTDEAGRHKGPFPALQHIPAEETGHLAEVAHDMILQTAEGLGLETRDIDITTLERQIVDAHLAQTLDRLEALMERDPELRARMDTAIEKVIRELPVEEQRRIGSAFPDGAMDSASLMNMLRRSATTAGGLMLLSSAGFKTYLALSVLIKSFSMLIGTTFPFALYMGASSAMAFLLSFPGALLALGVAATPAIRKALKNSRTHSMAAIITQCHLQLMRRARTA